MDRTSSAKYRVHAAQHNFVELLQQSIDGMCAHKAHINVSTCQMWQWQQGAILDGGCFVQVVAMQCPSLHNQLGYCNGMESAADRWSFHCRTMSKIEVPTPLCAQEA